MTIPERGYREQAPVDAAGHQLAVGYTTTFYPNTAKLSEAVAVRLEYGKEVQGIGIVLHPVRKVKLRGRITSGVTGEVVAGATIVLQRVDSHNAGSLPAPAVANFDRNGNFEIRDVTPGSYLIAADASEAGRRLTGQALLTVAAQDVENLDLVVASELAWRGTTRVEDGSSNLKATGGLVAVLEPRSGRAPTVNATAEANGFPCQVMAGETYDVYVRNLADDFYLSAIRVNGTDVMGVGPDGSSASADKPFELVLDSRGGRVVGVVTGPDDNVWSGASMALIPDPPQRRLQAYREAGADEYGRFIFRGVAPGKYIAIAWLDDPPCDYYDPDSLDSCRATGTVVTVSAAAQENVLLRMKPKR